MFTGICGGFPRGDVHLLEKQQSNCDPVKHTHEFPKMKYKISQKTNNHS
jgi:hypothetical protein